MKNTSLLYKIAILLAIGAGFISVLQTDQLRDQLKTERLYLKYHEDQGAAVQKEILDRCFEKGYKTALIDVYNGNPKYLLTRGVNQNEVTVWKREETTSPLPCVDAKPNKTQ